MKYVLLCLCSMFAIQVSSKEVSEIPYDVKVAGNTLMLNTVSEQYHEGEYYWGRFDCKGSVKLVVSTRFDLSDVKVVSNEDIEWNVKDNSLTIKAKGPFKVVIEPKGRIRPLILFADRPEKKKPSGEAVRYFAPGVHDVGVLSVTDNQVVYLCDARRRPQRRSARPRHRTR